MVLIILDQINLNVGRFMEESGHNVVLMFLNWDVNVSAFDLQNTKRI